LLSCPLYLAIYPPLDSSPQFGESVPGSYVAEDVNGQQADVLQGPLGSLRSVCGVAIYVIDKVMHREGAELRTDVQGSTLCGVSGLPVPVAVRLWKSWRCIVADARHC
jgi:hypothetical protein